MTARLMVVCCFVYHTHTYKHKHTHTHTQTIKELIDKRDVYFINTHPTPTDHPPQHDTKDEP